MPLNLSIHASKASIGWYFYKAPPRPACFAHQQHGVAWNINTTSTPVTATAQGTGKDPAYYTLAGALQEMDDVTTWNGTVYIGRTASEPKGTFTIKPVSAHNAQKPPNCSTARPRPPAPPTPTPPAPAPPVPDQLQVWPLPTSWTAGPSVRRLDATQFAFRYSKPTATPNTLLQAFTRYSTLIRPHHPSARAEAKTASRSLRRALLPPQVNAGSRYRCRKRT